MVAVKDTVVDVLDRGGLCSEAWNEGFAFGLKNSVTPNISWEWHPTKAAFSGTQLVFNSTNRLSSPEGFDRPLPIGATMAIEPKVVHSEGSIGDRRHVDSR